MKYFLLFLVVAVFSVERISGDNYFQKELRKLRDEAEKKLEKIVEPVLKDGHHLMERLQKIQWRITHVDTNTPECQQLQETMNTVSGIVNNIGITIFNTTLKIRQDILNIESQCVKQDTTLVAIVQCFKQNIGVVYNDIASSKAAIQKDNDELKTLSKTIEQQLQQCIKSQATTVKPTDAPTAQPTKAPAQPTKAPAQPTKAPAQPTQAPAQPTQAPSNVPKVH